MNKFIGRLSRVADSSTYSLLGSESHSSSRSRRSLKFRRSSVVQEGHLPVYVGDEMERFVVSAEVMNHPIFMKLLNKSAQEYGYQQKGVLHIPCGVRVFERVLEAMRVGVISPEVEDLINSLSD